MCTRILKKESSSRALAFVALLFMMPLGFIGNPQSCGAAEDTEHQPLLRRNDVAIPINGDGGDLEEGVENYLGRELPKIDVPAESLRELDSRDAVEAMKSVKTGLRLGDALDAEDEDAIGTIHREAREKGMQCGQDQTLGEVIIARGISGADVVQDYFVQNREKIAALIKTVQEHQQLADELRAIIIKERNKNLLENNRILSENKCLKTTRAILAICIPVAFVVAGVGAWALTWYWGGK